RGGALAPAVGAALGRDGTHVRVALSPVGGPAELRAGRAGDQLARRAGARAARAHRRRRLAHDAVRRAAVLRALSHHPRRDLRGGACRRRGRARHRARRDAAAAAPRAADRAPVPDARRAARVRPDVRSHRRRPRQHHRDADRLRVPEPLPDAAARVRRRHRRRRRGPRHAGRLGVPARDGERGGDGVKRRGALGDALVLAALALWAVPFFWQALTSIKPDTALLAVERLLAGFVREVPMAVEEAAQIDGAGRLATLGRVVLPLIAPGIASAGLLVFLMSWNELLFAYTFTASEASRTVPVALALFPGVYEVPWGDIAAASMLASLPPILIVAGLQRWLVRGLTAGALRD